MAKRRRKSNRVQASSLELAQAREAKRRGFIQKSTKTTGGKLSRKARKKVNALANLGALSSYEPNARTGKLNISAKPQVKPVKVKPKERKLLKERGIFTSGSFVFAPAEYVKEVMENVAQGKTGGLDVDGRFYIELGEQGTFGYKNYADLEQALQDGDLDNVLGDNLFAFTIEGFHVRNDATFVSGADLAEYLKRYKWTQEKFKGLNLVILPPGTSLGPTPNSVYQEHRTATIGKADATGRNTTRRRKSRAMVLKEKDQAQFNKEREAREKRAKERNRIGAANRRKAKKLLLGKEYYLNEAARKRDARARKKNK